MWSLLRGKDPCVFHASNGTTTICTSIGGRGQHVVEASGVGPASGVGRPSGVGRRALGVGRASGVGHRAWRKLWVDSFGPTTRSDDHCRPLAPTTSCLQRRPHTHTNGESRRTLTSVCSMLRIFDRASSLACSSEIAWMVSPRVRRGRLLRLGAFSAGAFCVEPSCFSTGSPSAPGAGLTSTVEVFLSNGRLESSGATEEPVLKVWIILSILSR